MLKFLCLVSTVIAVRCVASNPIKTFLKQSCFPNVEIGVDQDFVVEVLEVDPLTGVPEEIVLKVYDSSGNEEWERSKRLVEYLDPSNSEITTSSSVVMEPTNSQTILQTNISADEKNFGILIHNLNEWAKIVAKSDLNPRDIGVFTVLGIVMLLLLFILLAKCGIPVHCVGKYYIIQYSISSINSIQVRVLCFKK